MLPAIVAEIDIDAPPERVFQAWIDPKQRLAWWGDDQTYHCTKMDSDLRVGGQWLTEGKGMEGKPFTVRGTYTRIEPSRALGFTWIPNWGGAPLAETHVLVELIPTSSGTHVTVTHTGFTEQGSREGHNEGWIRVLGWLRNYTQAH
jgi:uncharacterized protein YndB with AHSA1/START domain